MASGRRRRRLRRILRGMSAKVEDTSTRFGGNLRLLYGGYLRLSSDPMTDPPSTQSSQRPKRADARRNYEKLWTRRATAFTEDGGSAPLEDIAERAGVGIGTLYRHFPTRQALLEAVYVDEVERARRAAEELADAAAVGGARAWLRLYVGFATTKRALMEAAARGGARLRACSSVPHGHHRRRHAARRARAAGEGRPLGHELHGRRSHGRRRLRRPDDRSGADRAHARGRARRTAVPRVVPGAERSHPKVTLAVLSMAGLAYAVLSSAVVPALPTIQHDLNASETGVTWLLTGYLLSASVGTAILGRLGDMYGKEHVLLWTLVILAGGTLLAARLAHAAAADRGPRDPGRRRRHLPARVRDRPRRVPPRDGSPGASASSPRSSAIGAGIGIVSGGDRRRAPELELALLAAAGRDRRRPTFCTWRFIPESPVRVPGPHQLACRGADERRASPRC